MIFRLGCLLGLAVLAVSVQAQSGAWDDGTTPYVQSPMEVVDRMLRLAEPKPGEYLIDLGSGDGRIVVEAARRYGARGLGVDLEPRLVKLATENARKAGVESLARFAVQDLFELDFSAADIVSAYLLPEVNLKLVPKFLRMKPGTRIVTHDYDMGEWPPDEVIELPVAEKLVGPLGRSKVFLFIVPADARGTWRSNLPEHGGRWEFRVTQEYQKLEVKAFSGSREQQVRGKRLRGEEIRLVMTGMVGDKPSTQAFKGRLKGDRIDGEVSITNGEETRTLPWTATRAP
jgi:SAM-dependent methyltransferase